MKGKIKKFKGTGLKLTPQRLAIFEYLDGNRSHPSAEDIYKAVSMKFPTMSFATVYNTLDALKQTGGVSELTIDSDKKRFDPNTDPHNHLMCIKCKIVVDVTGYNAIELPETHRCGFEILSIQAGFYGVCPLCKVE